MNKDRNSPFFPAASSKLANGVLHCEKSDFSGLFCRDGDASMQNLGIAHPWLRTHPSIVGVAVGEPIGSILGLRVYNGKLMLIALQSAHLAFFIYEDGAFRKYSVSVEEYPVGYDLNNYARELLYTEDEAPQPVTGADAPKLLMFPIGKYMTLSDGLPASAIEMPADVPRLEHATLSGGRVFGTIGQHLYISSARGCFDWDGDGEGETDPKNAFDMPITSYTERQTPVTALVNYQGNVLIFRENVIQKVVGTANPFAVKEVLQIGTAHAAGIKELNGLLYFIHNGAPVRFNGHALVKTAALPAGYTATGAACVYNGKYWFAARRNTENYLMHYDPSSDAYGVLGTEVSYAALAAGDDGMFLLPSGSAQQVGRMTTARTQTSFSLEVPLWRDNIAPKSLKDASLHCYLASGAQLTVTLCRTNDSGSTVQTTLAQVTGAGGEVVIRMHGKRRAAAFMRLRLTGSGDAIIKHLSATCVCARQKKV